MVNIGLAGKRSQKATYTKTFYSGLDLWKNIYEMLQVGGEGLFYFQIYLGYYPLGLCEWSNSKEKMDKSCEEIM